MPKSVLALLVSILIGAAVTGVVIMIAPYVGLFIALTCFIGIILKFDKSEPETEEPPSDGR